VRSRGSGLVARAVAGLAVAGALAVGCSGAPGLTGTPTSAPAASEAGSSRPTSAASTTALQAAQAELDRLLVELERTHPAPFHGIARDAWVGELHDLRDRLGELTREQALVELQRVVALLSRNGRDGHQLALPAPGSGGPVLPIQVYEFDDGMFITAAFDPDQADLVGARIDALNERPIADVLAALEPLVPRDGPSTVPLFRPVLFLRTEVLRGLGLVEQGDVAMTVTMPDGSQREVILRPEPFDDFMSWAGDFGMVRLPERPDIDYLADLDTVFTWRVVEDDAIYLRYTQLRPIPGTQLTAALDRVAAGGIDRVILDIRQNPGGDNHNIPPLLSALSDPAIDRPGHLFVITDHVTFSAASNLATQVEAATSAVFVGQAMGGGLNFWDDVRWVRLDDYPIPVQVGVSTRYWEFAAPDDPRLTIEPDLAVPNLASDFFAGRDPVLGAALLGGLRN
jgi:hypothetical protein